MAIKCLLKVMKLGLNDKANMSLLSHITVTFQSPSRIIFLNLVLYPALKKYVNKRLN